MNKVKKGDKLRIYCYKHDGTLEHVSEEAVVIDETNEYIVCANGRARIIEKDGRSHMTKEPAILFFYKQRWFNIIGQLKKYGLFYYCNLASPYIIDKNILKYIDYDLDLRVFPDGGFKVLDRNEYNYHKKKMNYPIEIDEIIKSELTELINMKRNDEFPFQKKVIEKYYKEFEKSTVNAE